MSEKIFELNDSVRAATVFKNTSGTAVDPANVFFKFKTPGRVETIYQYGVDVELVKDSTGNYHVDIDANETGIWKWKFYSTGSGQAADAGRFTIQNNY